MDSAKKAKHQYEHCEKVFNRSERLTKDIGETYTFDGVRERLIQWGAQVNALLKEGITHEESLPFEDRTIWETKTKG